MKGKTLSKRVIVLATTATMLSSTVAFAQDICKDETVYVIMKDNGKVEQRIVSTWIKGEENLGEFKDKCNLKDVKNVKGEETPTANGDTLTWNIDGKDLYYRGESERELPISVDIKYELNGKSVDPAEVKGQSGNFKITMKVKNNESKVMKIAGEDRRVYVPFVVASEIIMPNDNFKDVKINNGKMITDGNNANITFVAVPGLMESLKIDSIVDLDVKDEIVIEGKTEDFAVPSMVVMATTEGLDLKDMDANDDLDDLRSQLDQLKQGGEDLLSGAQELNNGEKELQSKYNEFNAGVGTLRNGAIELANGINTLTGSAPQLKAGVTQLNDGLGLLSQKQGQFTGGVNTLREGVNKYLGAYGEIEGGISQVTVGVSQVATGAPQLRDGSAKATAGLKDLLENQTKFTNEGVNPLRDGLGKYVKGNADIYAGVNGSLDGVKKIKGGLEAKAPEMQKLADSVTQIEGVQKQIDELKGKFAPESEEGKKLAAISQTLGAVANGQNDGITKLQTGTQEAIKGLGGLQAGLETASEGTKKLGPSGELLAGSANKLSDSSVALGKGIGDLYSGSATLTGKLNELAGKSKELEVGAKKVSAGSKLYSEKGKDLSNGANALSENSTKIGSAIGQLHDGSNKLAAGADALLAGANALNAGGATLRVGSQTLYDGSNQVMAGINKLSDGSSKLYEGVAKLKADGLDKINEKGNTVLGDIDGFMEVKDELVKLSDEYGTFSGLTDGMEGKVKFVMRINDENKPSTTESAKKAKEEENKKSVKVEEKKEEKGTGLFKNILSIFKK